jgi:hypothetical protein
MAAVLSSEIIPPAIDDMKDCQIISLKNSSYIQSKIQITNLKLQINSKLQCPNDLMRCLKFWDIKD